MKRILNTLNTSCTQTVRTIIENGLSFLLSTKLTVAKKMRNVNSLISCFIILALFPVVLITMSCSDGSKSQYGQTVIIGMKGDFDSFNELNASDSDALQVINNMLFMTLTKLDENFQIVPYLARSWEFDVGGKVLTYYLRKDVTWTDGTATTSDDVLFTYTTAINPEVAYPAASRFDMIKRAEVIDPYTIRFYLKNAYPDALFDTQIPILPKHILGEISPDKISQSDFNRNPIGNGPFKLSEWKANQHVIFEHNSNFAAGRPFLDKVIFSIIPDESVLLTNLKTGTVDVIPSLSSHEFKNILSVPSLKGLKYGSKGYSFLAWNCANPLFTKTVRRALSHAINKKEIIATLMEGYGKEALGPILSFAWAYDKNLKGVQFNQDIAKELLKSEGWDDTDGDGYLDKNNKIFQFDIKTNAGNQFRKDVAIMIQAQLKNIGIKADVDIVEFNLMLDQVFGNKDFDVLLSQWEADFTVNPTDLFHSKAITEGYNFISYENPKIDFLLEKGRATPKQDEAKPYWDELQTIILEDSPYTFLFVKDKLAGYNKKINGFNMDVRGFLSHIHKWQIPE